jgi:flavorubredoxin
MTPREPDRFYATAEVILESLRDALPATTDEQITIIAAALRQAADEALERAAQRYDKLAEGGITREAALRYQLVAKDLRALASPAAAPAADVKVNACQVDLRTDKDRECFEDIVQAATRVLRSEPVADTGSALADVIAEAMQKWPDAYDALDFTFNELSALSRRAALADGGEG